MGFWSCVAIWTLLLGVHVCSNITIAKDITYGGLDEVGVESETLDYVVVLDPK